MFVELADGVLAGLGQAAPQLVRPLVNHLLPSACQHHVSKMSARCQQDVSRMSATYQHVCKMSAR